MGFHAEQAMRGGILRELLRFEMDGTAFWRRLKAEDYPDDKRNLVAANTLEALSSALDSESDALLREMVPYDVEFESDDLFSLALSETARFVGFRFFPRDVMEFVEHVVSLLGSERKNQAFDDLPDTGDRPGLLLKAVIQAGPRTTDGTLIQAVTEPWFEIIRWLDQDYNRAYQMEPRLWEEMIAGAYQRSGFDNVILTPRSGDLGRDIIAEKKGIGIIRVIDQVKAYGPNNLVTADDVRSLLGVLTADGSSKGFLTTTSRFAPKLATDRLLMPFFPARLELVDGKMLMIRLRTLSNMRR